MMSRRSLPGPVMAILAVAGKIKSSNKPLAQAPSFYKVLEAAHGIARFHFFCLIIPEKIVLYNVSFSLANMIVAVLIGLWQ